jgi:hypothetical protein
MYLGRHVKRSTESRRVVEQLAHGRDRTAWFGPKHEEQNPINVINLLYLKKGGSEYRDVPKSAILQETADLVDKETTRKFSGLTSRCNTPLLRNRTG